MTARKESETSALGVKRDPEVDMAMALTARADEIGDALIDVRGTVIAEIAKNRTARELVKRRLRESMTNQQRFMFALESAEGRVG